MNRQTGRMLRSGWWWLLALAVVTIGSLATAPSAMAEPAEAGDSNSGTSWLEWIDLKDSDGISVWKYELSIDRGGVTSPGKALWAFIIDFFYGIYRFFVTLLIWFLEWVLSMEWISTIATPVLAIGDAMTSLFNQFGVVPTMLTIAAFVSALWIMRGKVATGVWEMSMALVIAAVAAGALASPVRMVVGEDGLITQSAEAGRDIGLALSPDRAVDDSKEARRNAQIAQLVDVFLRKPTQLINYGRVLDGGPCHEIWNRATQDGPHGDSSVVRDAVRSCDQEAGNFARNPNAAMAANSWLLYPSGGLLGLLAITLAGGVLISGAWVLFQAVKLIVTLIVGLLPGGGRGALMLTLAEITMALLVLVFTSVFLSVFIEIIGALFNNASPGSFGRTLILVDILLIVGSLVYWRQRKSIQASAKRLAGWMAQRPGGSAHRVPQPHALGLAGAGAALHTATSMAQLRTQRQMAKSASAPGMSYTNSPTLIIIGAGGGGGPKPPPPHYPATPFPGPKGPGGPGPRNGPSIGPSPRPGSRPELPPGPGSTNDSPGPRPTPSPTNGRGGGKRQGLGRQVVGGLVKAGANAGLSYLTGGTSTLLTAARRANQVRGATNSLANTRRANLAARIQTPHRTTTPATTTTPASRPARQTRPDTSTSTSPTVVPGEVVRDTSPTPPHTQTPAPDTNAPQPPTVTRLRENLAARRPAQASTVAKPKPARAPKRKR